FQSTNENNDEESTVLQTRSCLSTGIKSLILIIAIIIIILITTAIILTFTVIKKNKATSSTTITTTTIKSTTESCSNIFVLKNYGYSPFIRLASMAIGDINEDNNEDILILDSQGTHLKLFLNVANAQLTEEKKFSTGYTTVKISTGDMNHDKKVDVITTDFWTHAIIILYNTGDETFYHRVISTNLYGANV
ncbi:unnamed protein product, partial [Adineta steineri]